jgi:hypothetical protein
MRTGGIIIRRKREANKLAPEGIIFKDGLMLNRLITAVTLISLGIGVKLGVDKEVILPKGAEASAAWSHGILVDGTRTSRA